MYLSEKPRPIDFYKEEADRDMMMVVVSNGDDMQQQAQAQPQHQMMMMMEESSGEDHEVKVPKKRAETWVQEETRSLISLRREMDLLFNTSKFNKHLWDQISCKMREKGFDRSPTKCTDKWRNLLKEFKKVKHHDRGSGSAKMSYCKEIEDILRERNKNSQYKTPTPAKVDSYMPFSYTGVDDTGISFGPVEATVRPTLNLERPLDHEGRPLAITASDSVAGNGIPTWNWRETPNNDAQWQIYDLCKRTIEQESQSCGGRVISVKLGDYTRRIGIDGTADAIKEAIKSVFGLRTKRAFWLEDEDQIAWSIDRDIPLGAYVLRLDEGLSIKVCLYDESDHLPVHTEEKTFYTEVDYREFLQRRGWTCLRDFEGYRNVDNMDDLRPGSIHRGVS